MKAQICFTKVTRTRTVYIRGATESERERDVAHRKEQLSVSLNNAHSAEIAAKSFRSDFRIFEFLPGVGESPVELNAKLFKVAAPIIRRDTHAASTNFRDPFFTWDVRKHNIMREYSIHRKRPSPRFCRELRRVTVTQNLRVLQIMMWARDAVVTLDCRSC